MKDVIIKCDKGEVKKVLANIEKKDRKVKWATGDKPTGWGSLFERIGVYLIIECDILTFIEIEEFEDSDKKGKDVVSADEFLGKSKKPSIVIFRRGREVIAKDVATGNKGIAKCSPNDEFNFHTGASIALARLMAKTPDALNHDVKDEWIKVLGLTPVEKRVYTDADRNFKVGDRVVVRDWDDMEKEYGVSKWGDINKDSQFTQSMKSFCGCTATVTAVKQGFFYKVIELDFDNKNGFYSYTFNPWMFNPTDVPAPEKEKPEAKFKVGDYVTLKEDVEADKWYGGLELLSGAMYDNAHNKRVKVIRADWSDDSNTYFYECKGDSQFTFHYSEKMLDKWNESVIHEGDTVKVINTGLSYTTYPQWVGEHISDPDMAARYCFESPFTDKKYKVLKIAEHESNGRMLAFIEEIDGLCYNSCYLIEVKGLVKV